MSNCIVCDNNKYFKIKFDILKECQACKHIFADLDLNLDEVKKIYSKNYFFGEEYIDYINDKKQIEKNSSIRLKEIQKYINHKIKNNLFEIGCAYGFFLNYSKKLFNKVCGIDINKEGIEYAKEKLNLNVYRDDFLNINKNIINDYNIFCMFDVIEHLNNPKEIIKNISLNSKKESLLFITTGDISSLNAKIKGKNWRLIHPPSHIHYFKKSTIKILLEKNGFEVLSIKSCGYYRNLNFIFNKIFYKKRYLNLLIKILSYLKILNLDIYLNLFDIMFVVAKKK